MTSLFDQPFSKGSCPFRQNIDEKQNGFYLACYTILVPREKVADAEAMLIYLFKTFATKDKLTGDKQ
jgi:hypothetical protein